VTAVVSPAWLLGANDVVAPDEPVVVVLGERVDVYPDVGYAVLEKFHETGTPDCPVLIVVVTVRAAPPAVKPVADTVVVSVGAPPRYAAIVHSLNELPAYDDALLESTTSVVNVPRTGGELALEVGPVMVPSCKVSVKPGGRPDPPVVMVH